MKISHTKCETFISCPKKFEYRYIDKLYPEKVGSALSFGKAFDEAANSILQGDCLEAAQSVLCTKMQLTHAETEYSMVDVDLVLINHPESKLTQAKQKNYIRDLRDNNLAEFNQLACNSLIARGNLYLKEYQNITPRFYSVEAIQKDMRIDNGEGDELQIIVDFIVKMKGSELLKSDVVWGSEFVVDPDKVYTVVLDNKTSNKDYAVDSVRTSDQLATYNHVVKSDLAGFLVFDKRIKNNTVAYKFFIDKVPEEKEQKVFEKFQDTLYSINECSKTGDFSKNSPDACFAYGRKCDYYSLCKYGKMEGLKEPKGK